MIPTQTLFLIWYILGTPIGVYVLWKQNKVFTPLHLFVGLTLVWFLAPFYLLMKLFETKPIKRGRNRLFNVLYDALTFDIKKAVKK